MKLLIFIVNKYINYTRITESLHNKLIIHARARAHRHWLGSRDVGHERALSDTPFPSSCCEPIAGGFLSIVYLVSTFSIDRQKSYC